MILGLSKHQMQGLCHLVEEKHVLHSISRSFTGIIFNCLCFARCRGIDSDCRAWPSHWLFRYSAWRSTSIETTTNFSRNRYRLSYHIIGNRIVSSVWSSAIIESTNQRWSILQNTMIEYQNMAICTTSRWSFCFCESQCVGDMPLWREMNRHIMCCRNWICKCSLSNPAKAYSKKFYLHMFDWSVCWACINFYFCEIRIRRKNVKMMIRTFFKQQLISN